MKNWKIRVPFYLLGLFILALGVAVAVKADLGVAPVSSVPYTMTRVWGIEMGRATMLFQAFLVLVQLAILRRRFRLTNLLQVLAGIVFGYFNTFALRCVAFLPTPESYVLRLLLLPVSAALIAFGIFLYLPTDLIPLASEGVTKTVAEAAHMEFSKTKVAFDVTVVAISAAVCLWRLHSLGSVGVGTVVLALSVGTVHKGFLTLLGKKRDALLHRGETE